MVAGAISPCGEQPREHQRVFAERSSSSDARKFKILARGLGFHSSIIIAVGHMVEDKPDEFLCRGTAKAGTMASSQGTHDPPLPVEVLWEDAFA